MSDKGWVYWSRWDEVGMTGFGQMPKRDVQKNLQKFELEARKLLKKDDADHVVYGVKMYDDNGVLEEVRFYLAPMTDDKFEESVARLANCQVYAVHKMS